MEKIKKLWVRQSLKIFMWTLLILVGLFIILIVVRFFHSFEVDKTTAQVFKIHSTKLTLEDVMGENLPPDPGTLADQTVPGIDANKNGIRDDVELAIFNAYPKSAKTRAVLLQYALALQMETVQPFLNTTIATEVVREQSRGFECIGNIIPRDNSQKFDEETDLLIKFVENIQFNTTERKNARNSFVEKVRSYSGLDRICDIDISKLLD